MSGPTPKERIAKARVELARLEADRAKTLAERAEAEEAEQLERQVANAAAIATAEQEHGPVGKKLAVVDTDLGVVIVKRPNPVLFKKFQDTGSVKTADLDRLIRPCLVHPSSDRFDAILEELPATLARVANAVVELAGTRTAEVNPKS